MMHTDFRLVFVFLLSYGLGCFCAAYYLVRWKTGEDIRKLYSGTAGARNSGRILGKAGFFIPLAMDILKGVLAVMIAHWLLPADRVAEMMALGGVMLGHVFPAQLGFRGGKGVSVLIGATLMVDPLVLLAVGLAAGLVAMLFRRSNQSTVVAMAILPFAAFWICESRATITGLSLAALMVLFFHRRNIHDIYNSYRYGKGAE